MNDVYKTIVTPSEEVLFKEKGSKFFAYAFPVQSEEEVKERLEDVKKQHHTARHFCYAWQLGVKYQSHRVQDDGEPSNSAGLPIYGQLQAFDLTQVLVVVVRYFGGTKLGVGGLIQAYKTAAKMALEVATIEERFISVYFKLTCDYEMMSVVLRMLQEHHLTLVSQELKERCTYIVSVRENTAKKMTAIFENTYKLSFEILEL